MTRNILLGRDDFVSKMSFFLNLNVHVGRMSCFVALIALCGMRGSHVWKKPNYRARPGPHKLYMMENVFLHLTICDSDDADFFFF